MQFQMFHIRKREMALRRCNGAKPIHLTMLLTTELFITFIFVLICAICLTIGFDEYMVPKMAFTEIGYKIDPDIFSLFKIETWVAIITLIISLLIIWISVRKMAHFQFRKFSCKSYNHKSRWKNAMQVVQFLVATIFFFFVLIASIALILNYHNYQFVGDIDQYKQVGRLAKLDYSYKYKGVGDSIPAMSYSPSSEIKYDSTRAACVLDPALLKLMNIKIEKNISSKVDINGKTISTLPVYVFPREAAQVSKQLGITAKPSGFVILQKRKYAKLGYAPLLDIYKMTGRLFNLYIVRPQISASTIINMANADRINYDELETLAFPKDGKYEMMCTEINKLRHQVIKQSPTHIDTNISSAYEYWFYGLAIIRFQLQLCFVLVLISLVSIILTVYSSITLETRERQKEMAIRKVNGAKAHDIAKQLCRPYITNLLIAFMLTGFIGLSVIILFVLHHNYHSDVMILALADYFISILTITLVTAITIWQKVYKIARISPADIIKKE
jgi:ABC-type antimicrobial peptide transport system permease subunit